ncbi:MAG: hypothetical protein HY394_03585 [Candidatus Diapherotrites archaeon]|nr:hypothetical protein [Candidatus Diapherotrites archaeon]
MEEDPSVWFFLRFEEADKHAMVSILLFMGSAFVFLTQPGAVILYLGLFFGGIILHFTSGLL